MTQFAHIFRILLPELETQRPLTSSQQIITINKGVKHLEVN